MKKSSIKGRRRSKSAATVPGLPRANSATTPPGPFRIVEQPARPRRLKGPEPGTVGYGRSDRALFKKLERLIPKHGSASAAARKLVDDGVVEGGGTPESKAHRIARRYIAEHRG